MTERLEEIKVKVNNTIDTMLYVPYGDIKLLIEQAERVQELEKVLLELVKQNEELRKSIAFYSSESYNAHLERLLDRREQQNERYREALEFYENPYNWQDGLVSMDAGDKARQALEREG